MENREELEAKAFAEFHSHLGKVIRVHGFIFGYKDEDSHEWQADHRAFPDGVRVRVIPTIQADIESWNDDWLDPCWNVELLDVQEDMKEGRSFWIHGTSFNIDGRTEKSNWELSNE